ncbi:MAG: hypothetical protein HYW63_04940 [Candidatus Levybacteria bacterium]|nr:hypothetical protein [Candidatus Levybacteria bacterium]
MKKPTFLLSILLFIILGLFVTRVVISNTISTSGVALGQMQDELRKYKIENALIREKIFTLSSLSNISSEAARIGFSGSKSNFALSKTHPIAAAR